MHPEFAFRIDAGPDAWRFVRCGTGIVVGRACGPGRIDDPLLEAHHLLVGPAGSGGLDVVQLAGRVPARANGEPVAAGVSVGVGGVIEVGATRLVAVLADRAVPVVRRSRPVVVLGVGPRSPFDAAVVPVTVDLGRIDRLVVTGAPADALVRSVAEQATRVGRTVVVVSEPPSREHRRRGPLLLIRCDDVPIDEPVDGPVVRVGSDWRATLLVPGSAGSTAVRRFHAAGRAAVAPVR